MRKRKLTPTGIDYLDPMLTPIYIQEQVAAKKAAQIEDLDIPPTEAVEIDESKPKREPVMAIHATLQERFEKELTHD